MKNLHIPLFSLLAVMVLAGVGCLGGPDTARDNLEAGDAQKTPAVEARLDFGLPGDAEIIVVLDNPQGYAASFLIDLSIHDTQAFFAETLDEEGYVAKRPFGSVPTDTDTSTSAVYQKGSEVLSVSIFIRGGRTEVGLQKQ